MNLDCTTDDGLPTLEDFASNVIEAAPRLRLFDGGAAMTGSRRKKLERLGSNASAGYVLDDNDRCEIRAALADLDATRAALGLVASRLRGVHAACVMMEADECRPRFTMDEAAAVLAAAGGNDP